MVLNGDEEGGSPPFDAPLHNASLSPETPASEYEAPYRDCKMLASFFATTPEVSDILPEGIEPYSNPPIAGVFIAHYPFSAVGEYHEFFTAIQVEDLNGEMAQYVPYIYVTNDAGMAAGREVAGAPKKIADIGMDPEGSIIRAWMDRPEDQRLITMAGKPEQPAQGKLIEDMLDGRMDILSIRHLPPIEGGDGCTQLVNWYADMQFHEDARGQKKRWTGPVDINYEAESQIDPIHKVPVEDQMLGIYGEYDMQLGFTEVHKEWEL